MPHPLSAHGVGLLDRPLQNSFNDFPDTAQLAVEGDGLFWVGGLGQQCVSEEH